MFSKTRQGHLGMSDPLKVTFYQSTTNETQETHRAHQTPTHQEQRNHRKPRKIKKNQETLETTTTATGATRATRATMAALTGTTGPQGLQKHFTSWFFCSRSSNFNWIIKNWSQCRFLFDWYSTQVLGRSFGCMETINVINIRVVNFCLFTNFVQNNAFTWDLFKVLN